jgi:hypothetical protein
MGCEILTYARRFKKKIPDCNEVCLKTRECPVLNTDIFLTPEETPPEPQKATEQLKEKRI